MHVQPLAAQMLLTFDYSDGSFVERKYFEKLIHINEVSKLDLFATGNSDLSEYLTNISNALSSFCGFERVMVYKFDPNWNGRIIAENFNPAMENSFLGLTFPSTDIPAIARRLFLKNVVRTISNVDVRPNHLLTEASSHFEFDLSDIRERATSEIHLEYLRNMGVKASATVALKVDGILWGLIAMHNYTKKLHLHESIVSILRLVSSNISMAIEAHETQTEHNSEVELDIFSDAVKSFASTCDVGLSFSDVLQHHSSEILTLLECDAAIVNLTGREISVGNIRNTPNSELFKYSMDLIQETTLNFSVQVQSHPYLI